MNHTQILRQTAKRIIEAATTSSDAQCHRIINELAQQIPNWIGVKPEGDHND